MKNFPMFLKMEGRRVLIIGGGEQAAQKVRLIQKTEAEIVVLSADLNPELQSYADQETIRHMNGPVTEELFRSAVLVFSATGCAGAGAAHAALARQVNVLINVVDMPELCEAMTPSIVDRDPLVVAIGTEGCAPILGRQVKSKIETMLEPGLGELVAFAGRMRTEVAKNVSPDKRRGFWKWVFNGAPRHAFRNGHKRRAFSAIKQAIEQHAVGISVAGEISVIQSAKGAAEQLRLRDVARLQEADLIYYVEGLHEDILEMARRDAERVAFVSSKDMLKNMKSEEFERISKKRNISVITATVAQVGTRVH